MYIVRVPLFKSTRKFACGTTRGTSKGMSSALLYTRTVYLHIIIYTRLLLHPSGVHYYGLNEWASCRTGDDRLQTYVCKYIQHTLNVRALCIVDEKLVKAAHALLYYIKCENKMVL